MSMQIYTVGGAVRDRLLGRPVTDIDRVVVGASVEQMQALGYKPVGADFPVFLHPDTGEEYALARTERKSGRGYGGFTFHASPNVTLEQDLARRDLTINAMAEDDHGQVIDPYGGQQDLALRLLRHVAPAFAEDPLRVLRVARFAARYATLGFTVAPDTLELMRQLAESGELQALTPERSWKEIARALMEPSPEVFIQTLADCGALGELMPGVRWSARHADALQSTAQAKLPLPGRWACLLHGMGDGARTLSERLKVPRECLELAVLLERYAGLAAQADTLEPAVLLDLLQHFDIFRRPQRFEAFLDVLEVVHPEGFALREWLVDAMQRVRAVQAQPLIAQGLGGQALGEALKQARLQALPARQPTR
ncbi:tRNA nucleotidyltransferase (CCA-adding enzyme) [Pseudomonas sp. URIL14HWK12:I9]|nr:tRNA nucleotidyltransferase (CCA-adding enzyme) [Pseudomonas sp. URIL14HWK12:I12]PVZ25106.1 tRNA nucleotidyltransferase (CCA-adding enzyme) [Pseudomonas sp. URIL14HWK12:I10]PVZ34952.1 tRNA nucleotidyltransferase (CCA-adding enzyme) [Pseudomonas sp. URIL14HWK12:I11]SNZ09752.1 tRNA nucleotidyltransferase (CCA-adding enzyme) [Pseudomonas sp. URIL14HWK12:I9]